MDIQDLERDSFEFIRKNELAFVLFLLSTLLFIYQHANYLSWDFSAYVLNARYLFYNGSYFETLRAPLTPLLLGLFLIFGSLGEYFYILFVSSLFFYSTLKLSDVVFIKLYERFGKEFVRFIFYFFSLSSFSILYSLGAGTELLALSFFEIFLSHLLESKVSGHFLALAFLTRYSFFIFFPLLFFNKNYKKILKNILLFFIVVFPWSLFNFIKFGNWFTSFIDSYANNIYFRGYLFKPFDIRHILVVIGWFLPFFIMGFVFFLYKLFRLRENWFKKNKVYLLFLLIGILIIYDYSNIPLKQIRYLFNLILPVAFFSSLGTFYILSKFGKKEGTKKIILLVFMIIFILTSLSMFKLFNYLSVDSLKFFNASDNIKELEIEKCEILTPNWVLISYFTENAYPLGRNELSSALQNNKIILIFYNESTIDDTFDIAELEKYKKFYETGEYGFFVDENFSVADCSQKYVFDSPYVNNHCEILANKFRKLKLNNLALKACEKINSV